MPDVQFARPTEKGISIGVIIAPMSKFYTKKGDDGTTGILGGERVYKDHPRPEAVGAIDEANATLGMARSMCQNPLSAEILLQVQRNLYQLMAEVSASPENAHRFRSIGDDQVTWLEDQMQTITVCIEIPNEFIIPGDTPAGAALDIARTAVRRAERRVAGLYREELIDSPHIPQYLNRLSSLCFVLELLENQHAGNQPPTLAKHPSS